MTREEKHTELEYLRDLYENATSPEDEADLLRMIEELEEDLGLF